MLGSSTPNSLSFTHFPDSSTTNASFLSQFFTSHIASGHFCNNLYSVNNDSFCQNIHSFRKRTFIPFNRSIARIKVLVNQLLRIFVPFKKKVCYTYPRKEVFV